jgi:hypothetical protein
MGASRHRFDTASLVLGVALCAASACGGAASTPLDQPPASNPQGGDDSSQGGGDSGGSSSGGRDATLADESNPGDDMTADANEAADSGDDVGSEPAEEAGPPDAGGCASACIGGNRCCTVPGTLSYGQCYSVLCGYCCPAPL